MNITIAIPTYNRPELIVKSIESALNQSKMPYEILVHDNSENNKTELAISHFPKNLLRYKRHSKNIGIAGNWNSLIEASSGDYIKFLNDDDILDIDCLAEGEKAMQQFESGVITCRANYITDTGKLIRTDKTLMPSISYFVSNSNSAYLWANGVLPLRTPTHSFYHTQTAKKIGGFSESMDYTRDVFFALRLAIANGAIFLEEKPLTSFLIHPGQDGKKIPFNVRVNDQCDVKKWSFNHCENDLSLKHLNIELQCILLREILLMIKNNRWSDALIGFAKCLSLPLETIVSSLILAQREIFPEKHYSRFNHLRKYINK